MTSGLGLFLTLALGLFILFGSAIVFLMKNGDRLVNFSIGMALGVMSALGILELFPEALEHLEETSIGNPIIILIAMTIVGIAFLKLLDKFIPDHDLENHSEKEVNENLHHIGLVSSIALVLHNVIEGMAIYSTVTTNSKLGLFMCIGVGLHNIPLGMVITSTFYKYNKSIKKTLLASTLISLSTFLGGVIMCLVSNMITPLLLGILLSITLGMIIYIVIFELIPHVKEEIQDKTVWVGIIIGICILLISQLF